MRLFATTIAVIMTLCAASAASAASDIVTIFSQDFSNGLSSNETIFSTYGDNFSLRSSGGNAYVGHLASPLYSPYANSEYDYYQVALDLTQAAVTTLEFDYALSSQYKLAAFNVVAGVDDLNPPLGLLTAVSGLPYVTLDAGPTFDSRMGSVGFTASSKPVKGHALFDLTSFAGQKVNVRVQFDSATCCGQSGIGLRLDNFLVTSVPEPSAWTVMITGLGMIGVALRRRRQARVSLASQ